MNIELKQENLFDILEEIQILFEEHYQELTHYKDKVKLKPVWQKYRDLALENKFYLFTARLNGVLVGYGAFFIDKHIHYEDILLAHNDVLFLKKEYRQGLTGIRLIKFCENEIRKLGANKITWHVKFSNDFRPILHRLGYIDEDVIVGKML